MAIKYSEKVIEHFTAPRNVGDLPEADALATVGSPACGDMVTFALKINPDSHIIEDIRFRSFGCASNIATASVATVLAKGKTIEDVKAIRHSDITDALDGLPAVKLHCSILAVEGFKSAIRQWEIGQGLIADESPELDRQAVYQALTGVLNPRTGQNLIEGKLIKRIEVDVADGGVFVEILLCDLDERFAQNIEEEAREKISVLAGVRKVIVQFVPCEHSGDKSRPNYLQ